MRGRGRRRGGEGGCSAAGSVQAYPSTGTGVAGGGGGTRALAFRGAAGGTSGRLSRQRVVVAALAGLVVPASPSSVPCSGRRKPAAVGRLLPSQLPFPLGSSMYYDEDGDLAHEFYEETIVTKNGRKRAKLKRIHKNLIPQVARGEGWGKASAKAPR